ncbi:MAG: TIGR03088 family PEP-CTERM/XrtA system glycosyltransferase [Gammaproteobacteria bacterium]
MSATARHPIRVAHVLYRFSIGGLENGLVNLINGLDEARYEHHVISLTAHDPDYLRRLHTRNWRMHDLHKRPGQDPASWTRMWRALRAIRPDILHTRNLSALEMQLVGAAARVRGRIHGEHGWDVQDLDGRVRRYRILRRVVGTTVGRFIALSRDLERYLVEAVGIPAHKVVQIYNGVDCERFRPGARGVHGDIVIGTVGRMQAVKNQLFLCRAFVALAQARPELAARARLRLVGDGPLKEECERIMQSAGLSARLDLPGASDTVAAELAHFDLFVLPSLAEGISNTILEAMATGLPVIATAVGGNPELVEDGASGRLVDADDVNMLAGVMASYLEDAALRTRHGQHGRALAETRYSLRRMVQDYDDIYQQLGA